MGSIPDQQRWNVVMRGPLSQEEKAFFKALGVRITQRREELDLTQVQVSKALGIAQQRYGSYEVGSRRIQVSMLPRLASVLLTDADTLLGMASAPSKRGPAPKFQRQIEQISRLPKSRQRLVTEILDGLIKQG